MRIKALASVALSLGLLLLSSVALAQYPDESPGLGNTDTWVMNVHQTLDANVVATYVDQNGYASSDVAETIAPLWNAGFAPSDSGLGSGWLGSMTLDSLRPIVSVVEAHWKDIPRGDGLSAVAYADAVEGAHDIFFPHLVKTGFWRSIITIQCLDTEDCEVYMTYRYRDGDAVSGSPFLDTIQPFSQETYDLWDSSVNPNIPNDSQLPSGFMGTLQVTSSQEIAGVARNHAIAGYALAYNGPPATSDTEIYFPFVNRRNFNGSWGGHSDWSIILVQNTSSSSITAYFYLYDREGNLELSLQDNIAPYGAKNYNMQTDERFEGLDDTFSGSVVVTSTQPIVGSATLSRNPYNKLSAAYTGVPGGSSKLVFPVAYRVKDGSAWRQYSGVVVQNVEPDNEIDLWSYWYYDEGTKVITITASIDPSGVHAFNTRYGDHATTLGTLGEDWTGTVVVTTTSPLGIAAVVHNTITYPDYAYLTNYNGIPVE